MAFVQFVFVLTLGLLVITSTGYQPDFYPGPCPNILPPSPKFQENLIVSWWSNTMYSNPSFDVRCAFTGITHTANGLNFLTTSVNRSGVQDTYLAMLSRTPNPGLYDLLVLPEKGGAITGKQMFYLYEACLGCDQYLLTWACVDRPNEKRHYEEYEIMSKRKISPLPAGKWFLDYLKRSGSPIRDSFNLIENKCCFPGFGTYIPLQC